MYESKFHWMRDQSNLDYNFFETIFFIYLSFLSSCKQINEIYSGNIYMYFNYTEEKFDQSNMVIH